MAGRRDERDDIYKEGSHKAKGKRPTITEQTKETKSYKNEPERVERRGKGGVGKHRLKNRAEIVPLCASTMGPHNRQSVLELAKIELTPGLGDVPTARRTATAWRK